MTREDIIRLAQEAGWEMDTGWDMYDGFMSRLERFANLVAAAERDSNAKMAGDFARKWWSLHCATNKHMETTLMAHNDFCALQSAIKARGEK